MPPFDHPEAAPTTDDLKHRLDEEVLPFFDSGRGSSIPSKQGSKSTDTSDNDVGRHSATRKKQKQKRRFQDISQIEDEVHPTLDAEAVAEVGEELGLVTEVPIYENKRVCVGIRPPPLMNPRSQYKGYEYYLPKEKESVVIQDFLRNERTREGRLLSSEDSYESPGFFHSYRLDDFTIYYPTENKRLSGENTILTNLCIKGSSALLFDGVLTDGSSKRYLEGVPFKILSVGNYTDLEKHDVSKNIWIQTEWNVNNATNVWYELGTPSSAYDFYYAPFVWLANFSKHFIDYLSEGESVVLSDFKHKFSKWILARHLGNENFDKWYAEFGHKDFRQAVAAHRDWLWNQVYCYSEALTRKHPIWSEVLHLKAVKPAPGEWVQQTVVTPYVHRCFEHMFGDKMIVVKPVLKATALKFFGVHVPKPVRAKRDESGNLFPSNYLDIEVGDVIAIDRDQGTEWKSTSTIWYAYVQGIKYNQKNDAQPYALDVIWLYAPEDTILSKERYPYHNELFFSDHCNCGEEMLYAKDVLTTLPIGFFKGPDECNEEFFIRQKYRTSDPAFLSLNKEDLDGCRHKKILKSPYETLRERYQPGDTVLVGAVLDGNDILEPVEIVRFDEDTKELEVRVLGRRHTLEDENHARPNELVYTDSVLPIKAHFVHRRCHVRFITEADVKAGKIPTPYDRDGTGDCFYISSNIYNEKDIKPFNSGDFPISLRQGYDPYMLPIGTLPLNGLDLFCGGGNFGRGIEEGGVVNMKWAVDIDTPAIHSYGANLRNPEETALYLGSINNYLRDAILGKTNDSIAAPGEVGFISAGSPCQGFSNANRNKFSEKSLRNCSLIASVATAVDIYRPLYALLENVHGMAATRIMPDKREINVYSQLLCCLVGMGYQCQQFTLDAWSFGSPQSRTRLFLSIAAPGQKLPPRPPRSHEHPSTIRDLALFKAPNGQKFGGREMTGACIYPAPKSVVSFSDLPWLGNNHLGVCIPFPDHRISRVEAARTRILMAHVPKHEDSTLANSWRGAMKAGKMPKGCGYEKSISEYKLKDGCKSWSRILEHGLCRTITTTLTPQCSYTGQWVHYDQDRLISIMEARRAQSFPDDEVLLGNASQVFKIVGNSVARSVALAWGQAIRYAYLGEVYVD